MTFLPASFQPTDSLRVFLRAGGMLSVNKADVVLDIPSVIPEQVVAPDLPDKADRILTPVLSRDQELKHMESLTRPPPGE